MDTEPIAAAMPVVQPCSPANEQQGIRFRDVTQEAGAYDLNRAWGVSWRDVDWDGRPDLLWVNHDKRRISMLHNLDGIRFEDVGNGFNGGGDAHAAALADIDADGLAELYIVNGFHLEDRFLDQSTPGIFTPATREGLAGGADVRGRSASWSDFDSDGDLDLHVQNLNTPDALFLQQPDGRFEDFALARGIQNTFNKFGAAAADLDSDGDVDLFIPILEPMPSLLLLNRGDGYFVDRTFELGLGEERGARAVAVGDYDNDGFVDLYLAGVLRFTDTEVRHGALLHNEAGEGFKRVREGVFSSPTCPDSRAAGFFDFDNDGWLDLYIACGADDENHNQANVLFHNLKGRRFEQVSTDVCAGADFPGRTGAFAVGDYNLDGLQDVAVTNGFGSLPDGGAHVLLRNESTATGNWLRVLPRGGNGNPDGLGATVTVRLPNGRRMVRSVGTQQGMGHNESVVHVGLGPHGRAEDVRVRWPDGRLAHLQSAPAGQLVLPAHSSGRLINSHPAALLGEVESFDLDAAREFVGGLLGHPLPPPVEDDLAQRKQEILAWAMARHLDEQAQPTEHELSAAWSELAPSLRTPVRYWTERFTISSNRQPKPIDQQAVGNEIASQLRAGSDALVLAGSLGFQSHGPRGSEYIRGALDIGWLDDFLIDRIFGPEAETIRSLRRGEVWGPQQIEDFRDFRGAGGIPPTFVVIRMGTRTPPTPANRKSFESDLERHLRRGKLEQSLTAAGALARPLPVPGAIGSIHGVMYDVNALAAAAESEGLASRATVLAAIDRAEAESQLDRGLRELLARSVSQQMVEDYVAEHHDQWDLEDQLDVVLYRFNERTLAEQAVGEFRTGGTPEEVHQMLELFPLTDARARQFGRYYQELLLTRSLWRRLTGDTGFDSLLQLPDAACSEVYEAVGERFYVVWKLRRLANLSFEGAEARAKVELYDEISGQLVEMTLSGGAVTEVDPQAGEK